MKILITGATGLLGKELGLELHERGHEVLALCRRPESAPSELPYPATVISWNDDHSIPADELSRLQNLDAVVNLMGENLSAHRWNAEFKKKLVRSRVESTRKLIEILSQGLLPKTWIQGSAIGYYGETKPGESLDEAAPSGKGFLAELCVNWEAQAHSLPESIRKVILRTSVVFSAKGGAFPQMLDPLMKGIGGVIGSGLQEMSFIHLKDWVGFAIKALEDDSVRGVFNLVAEDPVAQKELTERISETLAIKPGPRVPAIALKLLLGEMSETILASQAIRSSRLQETGFQLQFPNMQSVLDEVCSWHQHPFESDHAVSAVYQEQFIAKTRDEIFPFFSDPSNLEKLTPDFLSFKIKRVSGDEIKAGTKILYQLKLHGIPFRWLTLIATWSPPVSFVDQQVKGPYALWYHEHTLISVRGGTLMRDWVRYELPLGQAGKIFGSGKVMKDVAKIFAFRRTAVQKFFSGEGSAPAALNETASGSENANRPNSDQSSTDKV